MKKIINLLITIVLGGILYYLTLPAINLNNIGFYLYISALILIYTFLDSI